MLLAYLMARVFELHDRTRFEVSAISIGINDSSAIRHRLECAFDKFVEASELNDFEIASKIRKDEIDLLFDLSGLSGGSRPGIFAFRPAPIQISYLGYPGTMGVPYIDYLIAEFITQKGSSISQAHIKPTTVIALLRIRRLPDQRSGYPIVVSCFAVLTTLSRSLRPSSILGCES